MRYFLRQAREPACIYRSVKVALVVGTVLAVINHYDAIFYGRMTATDIFQIILTYCVPYGVSIWGSAGHAKYLELQKLPPKECK